MTSFKQAKDLFKMQREAKKIKKELKNIQVEAEADGVTVIVSGEQDVVSIVIADEVPRDQIAPRLKDALNRAMKKAQVVAAEKMQSVMGSMGMPTEEGMRGMGN